MVSTRGAVDLKLSATALQVPSREKSCKQIQQIERWALNSWAPLPPAVWEQLQVTRVAAASVLLARLQHTRRERLAWFSLVSDPDTVTLNNLAALQRPHNGTAGQAFELAVSDAVTAGVPEVADRVREGLRELNMAADGPLSMVALGLEKVPVHQAEVFWAQVRDLLPDGGRLRTGRPGRPPSVDTALSRLATASWTSMSTAPAPVPRASQDVPDQEALNAVLRPPPGSQLGRADALIVCGSEIAAVSLKINHRHVGPPWRDVPLWITAGPAGRVSVTHSCGLPNVTVTLPVHGWYALFRDALVAVDETLNAIDRGFGPYLGRRALDDFQSFKVSDMVAQQMWQMREQPIAEVVSELRRIHPGLREQLTGQVAARRSRLDVTSLNVPPVVEGWLRESETAMLYQTQQHLFRSRSQER